MIPSRAQCRWLLKCIFRLSLAILFIFSLLMLSVVSRFGGDGKALLDAQSGAGNHPGGGECAIVFGAAVREGSRPGPGISRRIETAVDLYHAGEIQTIILTGGKGAETLDSEAEVMRKLAMRLGVDPTDLRSEDRARSTWENLLFTRNLVEDCSKVVGISDRYHLARIAYLARLQGWEDLRTLPASRGPGLLFELRAVVREALGLAYYFVTEGRWSLPPLLSLFPLVGRM